MGKFTPKAGFNGKSVDGTVVSSNKNGAILRGRGIPTNVNRPSNSPNKSSFQQGATRWSSLTEAQQAAWNSFTIQGYSGYNAWMYVASGRALKGQSLLVGPQPPVGSLNWSGVMANFDYAPVTVLCQRNAFVATANVLVYLSPPMPQDASVPNVNVFRIVLNKANPSDFTQDITGEYEAIFGSLSSFQGFKIFYRLVSIVRTSSERQQFQIGTLDLDFV